MQNKVNATKIPLFYVLLSFLSKNDKIRTRLLVTSLYKIFAQKKTKIIFLSPPGGSRELKLRLFDVESKTTLDCLKSFFSK